MPLNQTSLRKRRIRTMLRRVKWELGCAVCGYDANPDALEWDHVEPTGRDQQHKVCMVNSWRWLLAVLRDPNIQVLCANCHAVKSNEERRVLCH